MYEQLQRLYVAILKDGLKIDQHNTDKVNFIILAGLVDAKARKGFKFRRAFFL